MSTLLTKKSKKNVRKAKVSDLTILYPQLFVSRPSVNNFNCQNDYSLEQPWPYDFPPSEVQLNIVDQAYAKLE